MPLSNFKVGTRLAAGFGNVILLLILRQPPATGITGKRPDDSSALR